MCGEAPLLTIGIVAHTSRVTEAKQLQQQVKAEFISIDNGVMGAEANHFVVQNHLSQLPSSWSVVLEDDALPVDGFRSQAAQALLMAPSPIVSFYLGRKRPPHWQKRIADAIANAKHTEATWIISTHLLHGVGYAIRTDLLPSLLAFDSELPADQHIGAWARAYGHTISYLVPSLVDHKDLPTIVDHPDGDPRRPGRKAWTVGTRTHWTSEAVTL